MAADCDWNKSAQLTIFLKGLLKRVKDELAAWELPERLNGLINLAIRIDRRMFEQSQVQPQPLRSVSACQYVYLLPPRSSPRTHGDWSYSSDPRGTLVDSGTTLVYTVAKQTTESLHAQQMQRLSSQSEGTAEPFPVTP